MRAPHGPGAVHCWSLAPARRSLKRTANLPDCFPPQIVVVADDEIVAAMRLIMERMKVRGAGLNEGRTKSCNPPP